MPERQTLVHLDDEYLGVLKAEAERLGIEPDQLAARLIREQLRKRTAPRVPRGKVKPFRRRPE